jgi:hypothetical protein
MEFEFGLSRVARDAACLAAPIGSLLVISQPTLSQGAEVTRSSHLARYAPSATSATATATGERVVERVDEGLTQHYVPSARSDRGVP